MKTLTDTTKRTLSLMLAALSIAALAACSKNGGGTSLSTRYARGPVNNGNLSPNGIGFNASTAHWGCIFNSNTPTFNPILQQFMPDASDLGQVSAAEQSCASNSTGVVFAGAISQSTGQGQLEMVIIDQKCISSNGTQCYAPVFTVSPGMSVSGNGQSYSTQFNGSSIEIVGEDSYGAIILRGNVQNDPNFGQQSVWEGELDFANNQNAGSFSGVFGDFVIPPNDIFTQ